MVSPDSRWLLLIHQIPPRPSYLRAKIGRRLAALGAVPVKSSVYVLPKSDETLEDFQWVRREIVAGRGDASVLEARFVEGLEDAAVEALFAAAREADYAQLAREARRLQAAVGRLGKRPTDARRKAAAGSARLRKRLAEVAAIDFFAASGRDAVEGLLAAIDSALRPPDEEARSLAIRRRAPRPHLGHAQRRPGGSHRQRVADPALRRSRGALQAGPGPRLRARAGTSCASTCSRASTRTRATRAASRC